jgi:hypothetical protein
MRLGTQNRSSIASKPGRSWGINSNSIASRLVLRASQEESISSHREQLEGRFNQRSRPKTAIKCKVETGAQSNPKELEELRGKGGSTSSFFVYVESEMGANLKRPTTVALTGKCRKPKVLTAYQKRKIEQDNQLQYIQWKQQAQS